MKQGDQRIVDATRKFYIMLPNLYDDLGLTPHEFRLLSHYVRVGNCWESVRTTARVCCMNPETVIKCRRSLAAKGLISVRLNEYGTLTVMVVDKWDDNLKHCRQGVRKGGMLLLPNSERCVRKEGTLPLPNSERRVRKEGHKEQPTRKNNIRKTQQEEQQQADRGKDRGRDVVAVVDMLRSIGIGDGPALRRARNGEITQDTAYAWSDWVARAPKSFTDPVAYAAKRLSDDPSAVPPGPPAESRRRCGTRIIDTLRDLRGKGLIE